jgi:4-amino-4-deoxy-L-arabinose transferase-like glycosyltransferase
MNQPRSEGGIWSYFAAVSLLVILVAALRWSLAHPYGIHWDESLYFNDAALDVYRLKGGMFITLLKRFFLDTGGRPPAFRLLALPVLASFGFHTFTARLISMACYGCSCWFIYQATTRVTTAMAGAFAVLIFALSPEVVGASIFFGTDAPLYLATSAMLYYIFLTWSDQPKLASTWIGLGLSIGLGLLSKTSFFVIAGPVLVFWFVAGLFGKYGVSSLLRQWKAGVLAFAVGVPWWVLNGQVAMAYAKYARGFVRNSLGPPSIGTWMRWLNTVIQCLLGHGIAILIVLVLIAYLRVLISKRSTLLDPLQQAALGACLCAGLPIVLAQLSGTNHLLRHITPAMIPLAIIVALLADKAGWLRSVPAMAISGILVCAQLAMLVEPVVIPNQKVVGIGFGNAALPWRTMLRFDQWDWSPVRDISTRCGVAAPKVSFLGSGRAFTPPAIQFAWLEQPPANRHDATNPPYVKWLWRYEYGPLDWQKVMEAADQSDLAITAPAYMGEAGNMEDQDNQHNAEFAARLSQDPHFQKPIRLEMGRFEKFEVDVFLNKNLVCPSAQ